MQGWSSLKAFPKGSSSQLCGDRAVPRRGRCSATSGGYQNLPMATKPSMGSDVPLLLPGSLRQQSSALSGSPGNGFSCPPGIHPVFQMPSQLQSFFILDFICFPLKSRATESIQAWQWEYKVGKGKGSIHRQGAEISPCGSLLKLKAVIKMPFNHFCATILQKKMCNTS